MSYVEDLFSLDGQTAVVIGGTGVLCGEMAQGLAEAGAEVVIVGRSEEKANERLEKMSAAGGRGYFVAADVAARESLDALLATVLERSTASRIAAGRTSAGPSPYHGIDPRAASEGRTICCSKGARDQRPEGSCS